MKILVSDDQFSSCLAPAGFAQHQRAEPVHMDEEGELSGAGRPVALRPCAYPDVGIGIEDEQVTRRLAADPFRGHGVTVRTSLGFVRF